jgi:flagellar motor switch protein FliM
MAIPWEQAVQSCGLTESTDADSAITETGDTGATVSVILVRTRIPANDLANLEVGDVIPTEQRHDQPVQVAVDGRIRFLARPGEMDGRKAIRIE